jgi:prepilin-type processing-associated H-X9-DG protein
MAKLGMVLMSMVFILATLNQHKFNRLPSVEAYEIRPGILTMPSYSDAGQVCQIVLERRHVSPKNVDLDAEMSGEEISRIFDELVPKEERGQPKLNLGNNGNISMVDGHVLTTIAVYENVSVRMYGKSKDTGSKSYVAATIDWEKRKCRGAAFAVENRGNN